MLVSQCHHGNLAKPIDQPIDQAVIEVSIREKYKGDEGAPLRNGAQGAAPEFLKQNLVQGNLGTEISSCWIILSMQAIKGSHQETT